MELPVEAARVLGEHHTLTLATARGNRPWASQVFYAEDVSDGRLTLYFATLKPSRKWHDLNENPLVSFAVGAEMPSRWVQGGGVAERIDDAVEKRRITEAITIKSPVYDGFIGAVDADFYRIIVDEIRVVDTTVGPPKTVWKRSRPKRPRGPAGFIAATRAQVLPVTLAPVALGAAFAWRNSGKFSWTLFAISMLGAAAMHLAANVINDVFDMRSGADRIADALEGTVRTGSPFATPALAVSLLGIAAVCGGALALASRPLALAFGAAGAALAYFYVAPPLALGYRGRGLGELAIFLAFGPLPVAGAYYVQGGDVVQAAWLASVLPGLGTTRILFSHHFLHYRADRLARKMTPVAAWGPETALRLARSSLVIDVVVLVGLVVLEVLPWIALAAGIALIPVWRAASNASRRKNLPAYSALLRAGVFASVAAQTILIGAILMSG